MKKVLVLFSGGKDSLLVALLLLEKGYIVYLVTYENGCGLNSKSAIMMGKRLIKKYGDELVKILEIKNISPIFREMLHLYYNLTPSQIIEKYGEVPVSQFNCLSCRLSMYIASIIICKQHKIKYVADGARNDQLFAIEQDILLNKFTNFFNENDIQIMFPLKDMTDDFEIKNQILIRGIIPKVYEPQCLLGMPLKSHEINDKIVNSTAKVFDCLLKDKASELISKYAQTQISGDYF